MDGSLSTSRTHTPTHPQSARAAQSRAAQYSPRASTAPHLSPRTPVVTPRTTPPAPHTAHAQHDTPAPHTAHVRHHTPASHTAHVRHDMPASHSTSSPLPQHMPYGSPQGNAQALPPSLQYVSRAPAAHQYAGGRTVSAPEGAREYALRGFYLFGLVNCTWLQ